VEREALEHECEQAEAELRAMQSELRRAEATLKEVEHAASLERDQRPALDPKAFQKAEAAQLRKLESQITSVSAIIREKRDGLRTLMSDKRAALAAAVEDSVDSYFTEQHTQRRALRERQPPEHGEAGSGRSELDDLQRSVAQLSRQLEEQRAEAAEAANERDALRLLLARREEKG